MRIDLRTAAAWPADDALTDQKQAGVLSTCAQARQDSGPYRGDMNTPVQRAGPSRAVRVAIALAAAGGIGIVASMLIAYLVADHSSSDSSPSSLLAVGLGGLGYLSVLLSTVLFAGIALRRLWHRARGLPPGAPASR
jgi:hypothetical protein